MAGDEGRARGRDKQPTTARGRELAEVRRPRLPGPRRRQSDREPVLAAEVAVGKGRQAETWHLYATNVGLSWGRGEHPLVVPWAAIRRSRVDGDDLVVHYDWPYVMDGEKVIRAGVGSLSAYLFAEEIERRCREARAALARARP